MDHFGSITVPLFIIGLSIIHPHFRIFALVRYDGNYNDGWIIGKNANKH